MRLGFVTGRWISKDAGLWTDAGLGRLLDELQDRSSRFTLAASLIGERLPLHDHPLEISDDDTVALPEMLSFRAGVHRHADCQRAIRTVEDRSDVLVVQLPFSAPTALVAPRKPRVYHVCADVFSIVKAAKAYKGPMRLASVGAALASDRLYRWLARQDGARVVTNGDALLRRYHPAPGVSVVSSCLLEKEIESVPRRRTDDRFRVLFVGHLRPEKGINVLIDAFEQLRLEVPHAELHIVGPESLPQLEVAEDLRNRVARLRDAGAVSMLGHKNYGPELFQCFADADVLALPSLSEGTPRVLIEARAFGCPVIASNVGGIPTSVRHDADGLLVPAGDPQALFRGLLSLARDGISRKRLIEAGLARARRCTVEAFGAAIAEEASRLLQTKAA